MALSRAGPGDNSGKLPAKVRVTAPFFDSREPRAPGKVTTKESFVTGVFSSGAVHAPLASVRMSTVPAAERCLAKPLALSFSPALAKSGRMSKKANAVRRVMGETWGKG